MASRPLSQHGDGIQILLATGGTLVALPKQNNKLERLGGVPEIKQNKSRP